MVGVQKMNDGYKDLGALNAKKCQCERVILPTGEVLYVAEE